MQTQERPLGQRILFGFLRLLGTLFVIALIGLVGYLASERNSRMFSLKQSGDQLVVMKGRMLPAGEEPWQPGDVALADAYAPVPLEGLKLEATLLDRKYDDRDELDRALFGVLEMLARPRVQSDDPKKLERGVFYLRRAALLSGLSAENQATLTALQGDVALYLARIKLDEARKVLAEALTQLQMASTGQSRNAHQANQLVAQIAGPARAFEDAVARALGGLPVRHPTLPAPDQGPAFPVPGAAPGPPAPAPGPAQEAPRGALPEVLPTDSVTAERPSDLGELPKPLVSDGP